MSPAPPYSRSDVVPAAKAPLILRMGFWVCIVIAIAVVLRRLISLASPTQAATPDLARLDQAFASHAALTLAHILPALLFVLIAPVIVFRRSRSPAWVDRAFYAIGVIVGLTAYAMSRYSVGGWVERAAVFFFDSLYLFSLLLAFTFRRAGDLSRERRWQLRSIAVLLGISTTRPVMGVFFATAPITHLVPSQFFGVAFWIGFSINTLIFELWIRFADRRRRRNSASTLSAASTAQNP